MFCHVVFLAVTYFFTVNLLAQNICTCFSVTVYCYLYYCHYVFIYFNLLLCLLFLVLDFGKKWTDLFFNDPQATMKVVTYVYVVSLGSEQKEKWTDVHTLFRWGCTLSQWNLQVSHLIDLHVHVSQLRTICFKANLATVVALHLVRNLTALKYLNKRCRH
jgi:hypothetical protein